MEPRLIEAAATNLTDQDRVSDFFRTEVCSVVNDENSTQCGLSKERKSTGFGYISVVRHKQGLRLHF